MFNKNKINVNCLLDLKERYRNEYKNLTNEHIKIGDYTYLCDANIVQFEQITNLIIGKFCSIASNVSILMGGEHESSFVTTYPFNALIEEFNYIEGHPKTKGDIIIGNDVWIGNGAKILSGVTIGNGAIIGANALVTKDVPPYAIVGGNPAKVIKYRFDEETIEQLQNIKWWDFEEKTLIKLIPMLQSKDIKTFIKKSKKYTK